jgi:hypothetical protein
MGGPGGRVDQAKGTTASLARDVGRAGNPAMGGRAGAGGVGTGAPRLHEHPVGTPISWGRGM